MSDDFNTRFTHAMLIAVIVLLTRADHNVVGGEIGEMLHPLFLITLSFLWAWGLPRLRAWSEKRGSTS